VSIKEVSVSVHSDSVIEHPAVEESSFSAGVVAVELSLSE